MKRKKSGKRQKRAASAGGPAVIGAGAHTAMLRRAAALHESGDLETAEGIYRQVLAEDPGNADAKHLLGMLAYNLGFHDEGLELVKSAITLKPLETTFLNNLGAICKAAGDLDQAEKAYRRSLKINEKDPVILNDLGNILRDKKNPKEARRLYRAAVRLAPDTAMFHVNLGNALRDLDRLDEAVACYARALELDPNFTGALSNLGIVAHMRGDYDESISLCERAIKIAPDDPKAHNNLANAFMVKKYFDEAIVHFKKAAAGEPDNAVVQFNLAKAMYCHGQYLESLDPLNRAMRLDPTKTSSYVIFALVLRKLERNDEGAKFLEDLLEINPAGLDVLDLKARLAVLYLDLNEFDKAVETLESVLKIDPDHAVSVSNYAYALSERGDHEQAMQTFRRALELAPDHPNTRHNLALYLLSRGQLLEGWEEYEWRWKLEVPASPIRAYPQPLWDGASLEGKRIVLWPEQGIGDEIRFASMIPDLLRQWGDKAESIELESDKRMVNLFKRSFPGLKVHPVPFTAAERGEVPFDFHCPTGSLGRVYRPSIESFPKDAGYLKPDPARATLWKERLAALGPRPKIGLCWHSISMSRSNLPHYATMADLAPILTLPGVDFVNLMYAKCDDEIAEARRLYGVDIHTWNDIDLRMDQDGVAALMSNLDLVISQPSAVSELAGALGVPVFSFYTGNFYFMLGTNTDVWHPNTRCFGKNIHGTWDAAFKDITLAVRRKFGLDA